MGGMGTELDDNYASHFLDLPRWLGRSHPFRNGRVVFIERIANREAMALDARAASRGISGGKRAGFVLLVGTQSRRTRKGAKFQGVRQDGHGLRATGVLREGFNRNIVQENMRRARPWKFFAPRLSLVRKAVQAGNSVNSR